MYKVQFFYGDYVYRQRLANEAGVDVYVEHHFNSGPPQANYAMAIVAHNASEMSKAIAEIYVDLVHQQLGVPKYEGGPLPGVKVCRYRERGDYNLRYTAMPAVLLEPLFVSNEQHVKWLIEGDAIDKLAYCLAETIRINYPRGAFVGFSVGHKYKRSNPMDRGAPVRFYPEFFEADLAEWVLWKAKYMLERGE